MIDVLLHSQPIEVVYSSLGVSGGIRHFDQDMSALGYDSPHFGKHTIDVENVLDDMRIKAKSKEPLLTFRLRAFPCTA